LQTHCRQDACVPDFISYPKLTLIYVSPGFDKARRVEQSLTPRDLLLFPPVAKALRALLKALQALFKALRALLKALQALFKALRVVAKLLRALFKALRALFKPYPLTESYFIRKKNNLALKETDFEHAGNLCSSTGNILSFV
jgi:hypothetical protein